MYVKVKKEILNSGEVMLRRKYKILGIFTWWREWKLLDNEKYEKEQEISVTVNKLLKQLQDLQDIDQWLKDEKAEVKDARRARKGISKAYLYKVSSKDFFYKRYPDLDPVDGKWRSAINPKVLGGKAKPQTVREKMGIPDRKETHKAAYTLKDVEGYKVSFEDTDKFDSIHTFKEPSNQKSDNPRKKRPDESDAEHRARLKNMNHNKGEDSY